MARTEIQFALLLLFAVVYTTVCSTSLGGPIEKSLDAADVEGVISLLREQIELQDGMLKQQGRMLKQQEQTINTHTQSITRLERLLKERPQDAVNCEHCKNSEKVENYSKRSDDTDHVMAVVQQVSQRLEVTTAEIQALKNADQLLRQDVITAGRSTYVRWGSSSCANTSELMYTGFTGGSFYSHSGGATNPLCLPEHPSYAGNPHDDGYAALYGSEYEVLPLPSHNLDALCAVCVSPRATTVMMPAATACHPGWSQEYSGYLMAGHPDQGRSGTEFICVDVKLEGRPGTGANDDGLLLYLTLGHCGSLPCPPYQEGKVISCVVCSK